LAGAGGAAVMLGKVTKTTEKVEVAKKK